MTVLADGAVLTCPGIVLHQTITDPKKMDGFNGKAGYLKYDLLLALPASDPCVAELRAMALAKFKSSRNPQIKAEFSDVIKTIKFEKYDEATAALLADYVAVRFMTARLPIAVSPECRKMPPHEYATRLTYGSHVSVIADCYEYASPARNGVAAGLMSWHLVNLDVTPITLNQTSGLTADAAVEAFSRSTGAAPAVQAAATPHTAFVDAPAGRQSAPVPPSAAPVPPAATPAVVMTAKAAGATYQSFIDAGWTHELMVSEGYVAA